MSLSLYCFSIPGADDALQLHQADTFTPQKGPRARWTSMWLQEGVWISCWSPHCNQDTSGCLVEVCAASKDTPAQSLACGGITLEGGAGKQEVATDSPTSVTCVQRDTAAGSRFRPMYHPNGCHSWCLGREFAYYRPAGGLSFYNPTPHPLVYWSVSSYLLHTFESGLGDTADLLVMVRIDRTLEKLHYTWATSAQSMLF